MKKVHSKSSLEKRSQSSQKARSSTFSRFNKRGKTKVQKKPVIIDFEEITNQVNAALDLSKVTIKEKHLKQQEHYKTDVDKQWNYV